VRVRLRAAAEYQQPSRVRDGEVPDRQCRDRRSADVRNGDPVSDGDGCERRSVEDHADTLNPGLASDGHELDHRMSTSGGCHDEHLTAVELHHAARRIDLRIKASQEGGLQSVGRL
jgi:hypothetical protein